MFDHRIVLVNLTIQPLPLAIASFRGTPEATSFRERLLTTDRSLTYTHVLRDMDRAGSDFLLGRLPFAVVDKAESRRVVACFRTMPQANLMRQAFIAEAADNAYRYAVEVLKATTLRPQAIGGNSPNYYTFSRTP